VVAVRSCGVLQIRLMCVSFLGPIANSQSVCSSSWRSHSDVCHFIDARDPQMRSKWLKHSRRCTNMLALIALVVIALVHADLTWASAQRGAVSSATQVLRSSWDAAYLADKPSFNEEPNAFLVEVTQALKPGTALDVGMGQGRNAVFLARQGWRVTGFDLSEVGINQAREHARKAGVTLTAITQSAEEFDWGKDQWDLIVVAYFPQLRRVLPKLIDSLKRGGFVVVEAFHADAASDRPPGPGAGVTFQANELPKLVGPLRTVRYEEPRARADWGLFETRLVRLLAQKQF
jgi:2-polyprenyl-3-methyl-5-hydroxy-6-metoxy-1,4-benzoquinol methylase